MPDFYSNAASDNFRLLKSKPMSGTAATAGTWGLMRIPKWAFVSGVWLIVDVACNVLDVTVGWIGNTETAQPAGFMSSDIADVGNTGIKVATNDSLLSFGQKYFDKGTGAITMTVGTTWATGHMILYCQYSVIR